MAKTETIELSSTTVLLPRKLKMWLAWQAQSEGCTMTEVIIRALYREHKRVEKKTEGCPPVRYPEEGPEAP